MQIKDNSLKVLRFQQITDASFLFNKGLGKTHKWIFYQKFFFERANLGPVVQCERDIALSSLLVCTMHSLRMIGANAAYHPT